MFMQAPVHPNRASTRVLSSLFALALLTLCCRPASAQEPVQLTTVNEIRELTSEQAAKDIPVHLRGVVTAISGWKSSFFFQDETSGISVDRNDASPALEPGQLVEVFGVTHPGMFAPVVAASAVKVAGTAPMPAAKNAGRAELSGGTMDSQWASVKGVVHRAEIKNIWGHDTLVLQLDIDGGMYVTARVRKFDRDSWRTLPTSQIVLRGVCGTVFNDRKQFIALRFFVSSMSDIQVLQEGPKDLFARPLTEISDIGRFHSTSRDLALYRVRGRVVYQQGDGKTYIQNGSQAAAVLMNNEATLSPGTEVEVVGYARDGEYSPSLEGEAFRVVKDSSSPVTPVAVSASEIIVEKNGFVSSPYDSSLVSLEGVVKQIIADADGTILFLQDGNTVFTARLPSASAAASVPAAGSLVEIKGICSTRVDSAHEPKAFRILVPSVADIVTLRTAPWWTAEHAKMVVLALTSAFLATILLLVAYRRDSNLRQLSLSDPLTGVHNRRGFLALAEHQWKYTLRRKKAMLLFYIDVDKFKEINDKLGHRQGDVVLQMVAEMLQQCFRHSDIVGRLGGDEFVVIACDATMQSASELKERLLGLVDQRNRELEGEFELSLSVGALYCDSSLGEVSVEELLARTDTLMYEQKISARNGKQTSRSGVAIATARR